MYNKKISNYRNVFRGVSLVLSVLTLSLVVSYFASAWTEPSVAPPGGNASAPLNVSSTNQSKEGRIGIGGIFTPLYSLDIRDSIGLGTLRTTGGAILNTGGAPTGLIVQNGNVGIGTTNPTTSLHIVPGEIKLESKNALEYTDIHFSNNRAVAPFGREYVIGNYAPDMADVNLRNKFFIRDNSAGAGDRFIIDTNGNVGIGTANPNGTLHLKSQVGSPAGVELMIENPDANGNVDLHFKTGNNEYSMGVSNTNPLVGSYFIHDSDKGGDPDGGYRFVLNPNGNVGIGTREPRATLDVNGNVKIGSDAAQANKALCWRADKTIGYCSTQPDATGSCTCNAIN